MPAEKFHVSTATIAEASLLAELNIRSWRENYASWMPHAYLKSLKQEHFESLWQERLGCTSFNPRTWIAWTSGEPLSLRKTQIFEDGSKVHEPSYGWKKS